jgi:hypothetical protein
MVLIWCELRAFRAKGIFLSSCRFAIPSLETVNSTFCQRFILVFHIRK